MRKRKRKIKKLNRKRKKIKKSKMKRLNEGMEKKPGNE